MRVEAEKAKAAEEERKEGMGIEAEKVKADKEERKARLKIDVERGKFVEDKNLIWRMKTEVTD